MRKWSYKLPFHLEYKNEEQKGRKGWGVERMPGNVYKPGDFTRYDRVDSNFCQNCFVQLCRKKAWGSNWNQVKSFFPGLWRVFICTLPNVNLDLLFIKTQVLLLLLRFVSASNLTTCCVCVSFMHWFPLQFHRVLTKARKTYEASLGTGASGWIFVSEMRRMRAVWLIVCFKS